ncbi:MAG: Ku protein [Dehalococcoidia bacterium]|nr:Ku protein [Dehalococcoidia bacterium]
MPRSMWKGAISFGLVTIPIRLYTATSAKDVRFHLLHETCHRRIKQQRFCEFHEEVVPWNEVVRGYEVGPDEYVVMEEEDFDKVPITTTHAIDISDFVSAAEIDPIYYDSTYYIEPEEIAAKPYALLREALRETGRVGIAKVALRQKEQLCTLRVNDDGVILMETMYYPDEIRGTEELAVPDAKVKISDKELKMATSLVDMLTGEFEPEKYHDEYREALLGVIEAKAEGREVEKAAPAPGRVTDLMGALRASIDAAKAGRDADAAGPGADGAAAEDSAEEAPKKRAPRRERVRKAG